MAQSVFDRRRINGPEESHPPVYDIPLLQLDKTRKGRSPLDIRPIFLQPGLISQATGSAYIETERSKIACAVYGPRQSKNTTFSEKGRLNVEVKFAPYSSHVRRQPMRDAEDRTISMAVHQALLSSVRLEMFPKSTIDVFITVVEVDGIEGCVAACSIAASTALVDAGIEVFGLVASSSAAIVGREVWLDPTAEEAEASEGTVVVACMPALSIITSVWQGGRVTPLDLFKSTDACEKRCDDIHSVMALALAG